MSFVEQITAVRTKNVESYWNVEKPHIKKMWGCHRDMRHWYLQNIFTKQGTVKPKKNCFVNICTRIDIKLAEM